MPRLQFRHGHKPESGGESDRLTAPRLHVHWTILYKCTIVHD